MSGKILDPSNNINPRLADAIKTRLASLQLFYGGGKKMGMNRLSFITKEMLPLKNRFDIMHVRAFCNGAIVHERLFALDKEGLPPILSRDWLNPDLDMKIRESGHSSPEIAGAWAEHLEAKCEKVVDMFFKKNTNGQFYAFLPWRAALAFLYPLHLANMGVKFIHTDIKRVQVNGRFTVKTLMPIEDRDKEALRRLGKDEYVIVSDVILATGSSVIDSIKSLINLGVPENKIRIISTIASPEGIFNVGNTFPNVSFYAAFLHEKLNGQGYVIPGIGDAGDKYWKSLPGISYFKQARDCFSDAQWTHLKELFVK